MKKIFIVLDSHVGELYNLSSLLFYWYRNDEIDKGTHLSVLVLRDRIENQQIKLELSWFEGDISIIRCPLIGEKTYIKALNFVKFSMYSIYHTSTSILTILPYDQKSVFYSIFQLCKLFINVKVFCIPHTTGAENYDNAIVSAMKEKSKKPFPIMIKDISAELYYKKLGFDRLVVGGDYSSFPEYSMMMEEKSSILGSKQGPEAVIFSLGFIPEMFNMDDWLTTHQEIFMLFKESNIRLMVKLHPSQSTNEFIDIFKDYINVDDIVDVNPETLARRADIFISVMTSAGQHAINNGKPHVNYASKNMRDSVYNFGNAPYPYSQIGGEELTLACQLDNWIFTNILSPKHKINSNYSENRKLASMEDIINELSID